jgi:hypothetical protein
MFPKSQIGRHVITGAAGGYAALIIASFMPIWTLRIDQRCSEGYSQFHSFWFVLWSVKISNWKADNWLIERLEMEPFDVITALGICCAGCLCALIVRSIVLESRSTHC